MELASGGSASSHESNSLKAQVSLVPPQFVQFVGDSSGPSSLRDPTRSSLQSALMGKVILAGCMEYVHTAQYFENTVRNVVQYEEQCTARGCFGSTLSYKAPGHTRVASASASFVFIVYVLSLFYTFALRAWGKKEAGGKIQFTTFLVKYDRVGSDAEWIASGKPPPRYEHGAGQG